MVGLGMNIICVLFINILMTYIGEWAFDEHFDKVPDWALEGQNYNVTRCFT